MLKLYENIKKYRLESKMTQYELAKLAGYTDRSSIAKIEKGVVDLSQSKIEQFAAIFGVEPGELMGWDDVDEEEPVMVDGLSVKIELLKFARSVPEDKAAMVLRVMKSILGDD